MEPRELSSGTSDGAVKGRHARPISTSHAHSGMRSCTAVFAPDIQHLHFRVELVVLYKAGGAGHTTLGKQARHRATSLRLMCDTRHPRDARSSDYRRRIRYYRSTRCYFSHIGHLASCTCHELAEVMQRGMLCGPVEVVPGQLLVHVLQKAGGDDEAGQEESRGNTHSLQTKGLHDLSQRVPQPTSSTRRKSTSYLASSGIIR